jgi:hypothetical protein
MISDQNLDQIRSSACARGRRPESGGSHFGLESGVLPCPVVFCLNFETGDRPRFNCRGDLSIFETGWSQARACIKL